MAQQRSSGGKPGRVRIILILALAGAAVFIYLRSKKNSQSQSQQQAASTGAVPTYSAAASGLYNGSYTPYTIVNANPTNFSSTFPGAGTVSDTTSSNGGGLTKGTININGGASTVTNTVQPGAQFPAA